MFYGLQMWWLDFKGTFYRCFIEDNRWQYLTKGLGNTLLITFFSLIIGVVLGLPFMFFGWELPVIANKSLTYLNNLCTPLALMSLGANFKPANMKGRMGYAVAASLGKTVLLPGLMVTLAALLGFRDASLGVVLILFGAPTAVSSYIMAKKMKNDGELAAQILLLTTLLCIVTIFIGIFILKTLALI